MKITNIETFLVDSGWWPFLFVKIETDEGITGYGECTETRQPHGVVGSIEDFSKLLINISLKTGIFSSLMVNPPAILCPPPFSRTLD